MFHAQLNSSQKQLEAIILDSMEITLQDMDLYSGVYHKNNKSPRLVVNQVFKSKKMFSVELRTESEFICNTESFVLVKNYKELFIKIFYKI